MNTLSAIARLHDHVAALSLPPNFARPRLTPALMLTLWGDPLAALPPESRPAAAREHARLLARLDAAHPACALIHADLGPGNLVFARGRAGAIDFDDAAIGPLAYDLAVLLCRLDHRPDYPALRCALAEGYAERRPPPDPQLWDDLIRLRRWMRLTWLAARRHQQLAAVRRAVLADLAEAR